MNKHILVIDDEESIRESFLQILAPEARDTGNLRDAEAALFGEPAPVVKNSDPLFPFQVETASSGEKGVEAVRKALEVNDPFAVVFCDMRMPGMDGLQTVEEIRKVDRKVEVIFVTAYSDHSIDHVVKRAGPNVSYFCKPFAPEEIRQLATKATYEWSKARNLENLLNVVNRLRGEYGEISQLLQNILQQVAGMLNSNSAMIVEENPGAPLTWMLGSGLLGDRQHAEDLLNQLPNPQQEPFILKTDYACFKMENHRVVVLCDGDQPALSVERGYLVNLFLEQATQMLRNLELEKQLIRKEQLSAVGQAISMAAHDLRSPVATIRSAVELAQLDPDPANLDMAHDMIIRCTDLSMELINDILDYVRDTPVREPEQVSLQQVANQVDELSRPVLEEMKVDMKVEIESEFFAKGDRHKLVRVLYNLVKNAAEALSGRPAPLIRLRIHAVEQGARIEVSDNGPGIPDDILEDVFRPFSTKGKRQGTGLGLAIANKFVEAHGSTLELKTGSTGTSFSFDLATQAS